MRKVKNRIARVINTLIYAMYAKAKLPKMLLIVLEDNIIQFLKYNDYGVTEMFGRVLEFMAKNIRSIIDEFKSKIPPKAKRVEHPQIIWIVPTITIIMLYAGSLATK